MIVINKMVNETNRNFYSGKNCQFAEDTTEHSELQLIKEANSHKRLCIFEDC